MAATQALALHEEYDSAYRATSADDHTHSTGRSWGNWFAFSSTQDLAGKGAQRAAGRQIFVYNVGFYACAMGTTKQCSDPNAPVDCQQTPCPPAGTPYLRQLTNGVGDPDNPSVSTATSAAVRAGRLEDVWVAFDALGSFGCRPGDATCLASPAASRRQIFMINVLSQELRQITNSALGDSVQPSLNRAGGMMVFTSTAPITGFPNPAGVPQAFVVKLNSAGNPQLPAPQFKLLSVGPPPSSVVGLGPSINPSINENGTGVAFQSRSDLMGNGLDTGVYQIYYLDFDKDPRVFDGTLIRVTNGNASSERPSVGSSKVPNPAPGQENPQKVVLFDSAATNLPGGQRTAGRRIYEAAVSELVAAKQQNRLPTLTTITPFGDCTWPTVDPSGNRLAFTCTGDPLQNGSTGNQAFALTRQNGKLYQITGAGNVAGPVANSIGQWFMTLATTSDLTQGGSCGQQLYVVDFAPGKWVAATSLGQLPPDAIPQGPNSRIGQRNFAIVPGGAAAGGSETAVTSRDGTTSYPVATTRKPIDQGNISMVIGAPDVFGFETRIEVPQNRVKIPPLRTPFGAVCVEPLGRGQGDLDCDGGREGGDYLMNKDHYTDDSDPVCSQGCRDNESCADSYVGLLPVAPFPCPFCNFPEPVPPATPSDTGVCSGGPLAGFECRTDAVCRIGLTCDPNDLTPETWVCQGAKSFETGPAAFQAGGARINFPVRLTLSKGAGPDQEFCTADDVPTGAPAVDTLLELTTGAATGTITDADPVRDSPDPGTQGVLTLNTTITVTETGAPFDCERLRAGDLAGAGLVGIIPIFNVPNIVPNTQGLRDIVLSLRFVPDTSALASCAPFCLGAAECDDGNPCNGTETCSANRCAAGTPVVCDDGDACNGDEICDPASGLCGTGTPRVCNDNNDCTTDACVPSSGCTFTANTGQTCSDSNACTSGDVCVADPNNLAVCRGTVSVFCDDGLLCNGVESCNTGSGSCETTPTTCDDANTCTTDTCDATLNGGAGGCVNAPLANNTPCDDSNACTGTIPNPDVCTNGVCGGPAVQCSDGNVCNGTETCDPTSGCQGGTPQTCDDANGCTTDSCDPVSGCQNVPTIGAACDDGSACTIGDQCTASGSSAVCTGALLPCNDGNACNGEEVCSPATGCVLGTPPTCDDGNVCTTDSCVAPTGCAFVPNSNPCDDGEACTQNDVCTGGVCTGTSTVCDDGNRCNGDETCDPLNPSVCLDPPDLNCDDGNPCTDDSCDPSLGCVNTPNTQVCDDGSACTTGDVCTAGSCTGTPLQCSDNNACNGTESCDPGIGCLAGTTPNCDDADECTEDTCDPVLGCRNASEPEAYALCRLNVLADYLLQVPADQLGGVRRKRRYVNQVTGSIRALQRALVASPRQKAQNLRKSQRRLSRLNDGVQKSVDVKIIEETLGNTILDLVAKAARALQALGR